MAASDIRVHPAIEKIREDLAAIELDVCTSFTVADAMREGAEHTGQLVRGYVEETKSCGHGAAYLSAKARGYVE